MINDIVLPSKEMSVILYQNIRAVDGLENFNRGFLAYPETALSFDNKKRKGDI